jgi:hypothetical protein
MARIETRKFGSRKMLLVISENELESKMIDAVLGSKVPVRVNGEVKLSDGYVYHYISLEQVKEKK